MSGDTPAPDDVADLRKDVAREAIAICYATAKGKSQMFAYGCKSAADAIYETLVDSDPDAASSVSLAADADAIRRARVEAWEEAVAVARSYPDTEFAEVHSVQAVVWNVSANIAEAIRRLITASAIPPEGEVSLSTTGGNSEEPSRGDAAPMTLGSSDALAVMEAMGKALEPFERADRAIGDEPGPFRFETANGYRNIAREHLREATYSLAAFRAWQARSAG